MAKYPEKVVEIFIKYKSYKFEELNPETKGKIISILKDEFKKKYPEKIKVWDLIIV